MASAAPPSRGPPEIAAHAAGPLTRRPGRDADETRGESRDSEGREAEIEHWLAQVERAERWESPDVLARRAADGRRDQHVMKAPYLEVDVSGLVWNRERGDGRKAGRADANRRRRRGARGGSAWRDSKALHGAETRGVAFDLRENE